MKKSLIYLIFLFFSFIGAMVFGAVVKYNYEYDIGEKYQFLQKIVMLFTDVPFVARKMIKNQTLNLNKLIPLSKHKNKKRFEQFIENKRNAILVLPRYEHSLSRSIVDIIDLNNFEVIHTYKHDIDEMNNQVTNTKEFPRLKIDESPIRFEYRHPLLLEDGSIIADSDYSVEFKIDFCSNLQWINDEETFHHSKMLDHEGNIWISGQINSKSQFEKIYPIKNFRNDSIIKINIDGKILFNKSVTEILIENRLVDQNFFISKYFDPIHLNDIEPALTNTEMSS